MRPRILIASMPDAGAMQRLVNILLLFKEYVVLALFILLSLVILSLNDNRQLRAIRAYAVGGVGILQDATAIIPNVFELKRENHVLRQLNVNLSDEVSQLREARLENLRLRKLLEMRERTHFPLITASVIGKSLYLLRNTITMSAGEEDSIRIDMPIISDLGLVGRVIATSQHYSVGQLLINKDFRASAKIQRSRVDGIIAWDGGEFLQFKNVAKTQDVREGDVVTTSEYSNLFPADLRIGTVVSVTDQPGSLFKQIDIIPGVDFPSLEEVFVVRSLPDTQRVALEQKITKRK